MDRVPDQAQDALEHGIGQIFIDFPQEKGKGQQNGCNDGIFAFRVFLFLHMCDPLKIFLRPSYHIPSRKSTVSSCISGADPPPIHDFSVKTVAKCVCV